GFGGGFAQPAGEQGGQRAGAGRVVGEREREVEGGLPVAVRPRGEDFGGEFVRGLGLREFGASPGEGGFGGGLGPRAQDVGAGCGRVDLGVVGESGEGVFGRGLRDGREDGGEEAAPCV